MNDDFMHLSEYLRNESLLKTEALFVSQSEKWITLFTEHFQSVCVDLARLQNESSLSAMSYLEYTMLYTNFVNRRYVSEVWVYGERCYLDKNQSMIGEFDISFLFVYFDALWDMLLDERKRYIGKVTARAITTFMLESVRYFYSYLFPIARIAISHCVDKKPFTDIVRDDLFKITIGDYMAETEIAYAEKKNKNAIDLNRWFSEKLMYEYHSGDYSGLDFSGKNFSSMDFDYAYFRVSKLNSADFDYSSLVGVIFRNAYMGKCCLDNCCIHEADFSNAKLNNASLVKTIASVGVEDKELWGSPGNLSVCFKNADLTGANFTQAKLTGANFTGANLKGADFSGAILTGSDFTGANLSDVNFFVTIMSDVNFTNADLSGAIFTTAILSRANFTNSVLTDTVFDGCIGRD